MGDAAIWRPLPSHVIAPNGTARDTLVPCASRSAAAIIDQLGATKISVAPFQPCLRLPTQPIQGFELGFERLNHFNGAVRPFSLDGPLATRPYYRKDWFAHNLSHAGNLRGAS